MKRINRIALICLGVLLSLGSVAVFQYVCEYQRFQLVWDLTWQGWRLKQKKCWLEAEHAFLLALRYEEPKHQGHLYLELAEIYQKQKLNPKSIAHYQKALLYDLGREQRADAHLQLGDLLAEKDSLVSARAHWHEAAQLTPAGMPLMAAGYMVHKDAEARLRANPKP